MTDILLNDIKEFYSKFGFDISHLQDSGQVLEFVKWRADFINEELEELYFATEFNNEPEIVDALIDIIVVSLGTLHLLKIDSLKAWKEVHNANIEKIPGIKATRNNPFSFPDLIKPTEEIHGYDWKPPSHEDNLGLLKNV